MRHLNRKPMFVTVGVQLAISPQHEGTPGSFVGQHGSDPDRSKASYARPAVTIAISKQKGANAVSVSSAILKRAEELQQTVLPDDVDLIITRNAGLTANEKVNELIEALGIAILIVILLLTIGMGWRGVHRGHRRTRSFRAHFVCQFALRFYDQPRDPLCINPSTWIVGRRSDCGCRKHRKTLS